MKNTPRAWGDERGAEGLVGIVGSGSINADFYVDDTGAVDIILIINGFMRDARWR